MPAIIERAESRSGDAQGFLQSRRDAASIKLFELAALNRVK